MRASAITMPHIASVLMALSLAGCDRTGDAPLAKPEASSAVTGSAMAPDPQDTVGGEGIVADTTFSSAVAPLDPGASGARNMEDILMSDEPTSAGLPSDGTATAAQSILNEIDRRFLTDAIDGSAYDLALARLGFDKAKEPEVKLFAERLMALQQQTYNKLLRMATSHGLDLRTSLLRDQQLRVDHLAQTSGNEFDTRLLDLLGIKAQKTNIVLYEKAVHDAEHPEVREFAQVTLPLLRRQLDTAQALQRAQAEAQTANPMP